MELGLVGIDLFYLCDDVLDDGHALYPLEEFDGSIS
jgi:hypothetical protein